MPEEISISVPIVQGTTLNVSPVTGTFFSEQPSSGYSGIVWDIADWTKEIPPFVEILDEMNGRLL